MEEPKPEQFGLTQEQVDHIKSKNSKVTRWLIISGIVISLLICASFIFDIVVTNYHPVFFTLVPATVIMLPVFFIGVSLITMIAIALYFRLLKINSPVYRKFLEYDSALKEYEKSVEEGE